MGRRMPRKIPAAIAPATLALAALARSAISPISALARLMCAWTNRIAAARVALNCLKMPGGGSGGPLDAPPAALPGGGAAGPEGGGVGVDP